MTEAGLRPLKRLGQHFLVDGNLMRKLVDAAEISVKDVVLEVGFGTGSLTELLVCRAGWVVAVEIDRGLFDHVSGRLAEHDNLTLLRGDVLQSKSKINPAILSALRDAQSRISNSEHGHRNVLVANLPYHIASPLIIDLLTADIEFSRFCFTVQKEMAQRIMGKPSTKDYGPMSIVLQSCCRIRHVADLPAHVFWPAPNVDSTALRLDIDTGRFESARALGRFTELLRLAFSHRRKTLRYNLRRRYTDEVLARAFEEVEVDPGDRPETLSVDKWLALFERLALSTRDS